MNIKEDKFLSYSLATLILSGVNETSADKMFFSKVILRLFFVFS